MSLKTTTVGDASLAEESTPPKVKVTVTVESDPSEKDEEDSKQESSAKPAKGKKQVLLETESDGRSGPHSNLTE